MTSLHILPKIPPAEARKADATEQCCEARGVAEDDAERRLGEFSEEWR